MVATEPRWWVVHTKSRHEKALALDLDRRRIHCFLPLVPVERFYGGRKERVRIPLFPGYLFMNGSDDERLATLETNRAANVIPVTDQQRLARELEDIQRMVQSDRPIDVAPAVRVGRRCCVTKGPLKGLEGVVIRRRGSCRVHVAIHVLGQGAELEIDASCLQVLDEDEAEPASVDRL